MEARKASEHERGSELHSMSGIRRLSWNEGRLHISRAKNAFELAEGSELDPGYLSVVATVRLRRGVCIIDDTWPRGSRRD